MDCNKEEAIKAKDLAVMKMQNGDFVGAQRIALRARQLFPDLDDISQLLVVCEVHCAAQNKLNGSEMDWYGILQIEKFSDEAVIKKQFRKLALSLHPDKNKFAGAEAAFKLIGEANRVLTDPTKRPTYDMKCRSPFVPFVPKPASNQSYKNSFVKKQYGTANVFPVASHAQHSPSACQPPPHQTFWTSCPSCNVRFQYHKEYVKKTLRCQNCREPFVAHDLGIPLGSSVNKFFNKKRVPNQDPSKVLPQNHAGMSFSHRFSGSDSLFKAEKGAHADGIGTKPKEAKVENASVISGGFEPQEKDKDHVYVKAWNGSVPVSMSDAMKFKEPGSSESATNKRCRKQAAESSRNFNKGSRPGNEENKFSTQNSGPVGHQFRRSSRQKQHISYKENFEDDDNDDVIILPSKRSRGECSSYVNDVQLKTTSVPGRVPKEGVSAGSVLNGNYKEVKQKTSSIIEERSKNDACENDLNKTLKSEVFVCADPNFSNFERARAEDCFAVNQVWALYDSHDGMPRFYALVEKVFSPGFRLQIAWLEATSNNKAEQHWCDEGLPVACGMYKIGDMEVIISRMMFSHRMNSMDGGCRGTYLIYPKKGETWALFKDWNLEWSLEPEKHRSPHQFEYVEVVTDFIEDVGVGVAYLGKIEGYVSIFQQAVCDEVLAFCLRPSELYRFSHRIPSCRITGKEGEGIPEGSFEFDTAALPSTISGMVDTEKFSMFENGESGSKMGISTNGIPSEESILKCKDKDRVNAGQQGGDGNRVASHGKSTQSVGSNSCCRADERVLINKKREENKFTAVSLTPRKSPRDLGTGSNRGNASQSIAEDINKHRVTGGDQRDGQSGASSRQSDDKMQSDGKDGRPLSPCKDRNSSTSTVVEVEDYDFKKEISDDKFQVGQIWAVHSDKDVLPKNYAQVKKIESKTDFRLHVAMLETGTPLKDKMQPASCGTFIVKNVKSIILLSNAFSHQVKATSIRRNTYEIYPRKGEIWAVFKNWTLTSFDQGKMAYDIVEVVEDNSSSVKVVVLRPVKGLDTFYMFPTQKRLKASSLEIPRSHSSRFSHQCSAYQHLIEKDGQPRGFWQLNPTSIPGNVILIE